MYEGLMHMLGMGGGAAASPQQAGPRTLGQMPNPGAGQVPQGPQGPQQPAQGIGAGFMERLQDPALLGLLGAGTGMLGAAQRPGGLGQATISGMQGGLGSMLAAQQAQKEDERNAQLERVLGAQYGVMQQGALGGQRPRGMAAGGLPRQSPGLGGGAY